MKFDKVTPKSGKPWPKEKVYQRISWIKGDIAQLNRTLNYLQGRENEINEQRKNTKTKLSNKWKYLRQLTEQLKEVLV